MVSDFFKATQIIIGKKELSADKQNALNETIL